MIVKILGFCPGSATDYLLPPVQRGKILSVKFCLAVRAAQLKKTGNFCQSDRQSTPPTLLTPRAGCGKIIYL
ncbi:hypothetical protein [Tychonema sp. LEGE 07203]|uniref:hypothetical protein n=1 Tax=Tychonema sp. LEGE 07203 TaxID=1828671 RepID=UPI0018819D4A|nr:hypothetical protein [Tychonema sp. LEGE 07203]MBE9095140.1 hypothetical protein [Tychonema sp. LEGE 07203]